MRFWNHTSGSRIIVSIDFRHPDLTLVEIAFLEGLDRVADP
jgi:hypothetical protein